MGDTEQQIEDEFSRRHIHLKDQCNFGLHTQENNVRRGKLLSMHPGRLLLNTASTSRHLHNRRMSACWKGLQRRATKL